MIRGNFIRNTSKAAINWTSQAIAGLIEGNYIEDITGNGTAPGIQVNGGAGARVIGNYITGTQGPGVYIDVDSLGTVHFNG